MLRADIEKLLKSKKQTQIDLILNEKDLLAIYCTLQNGYLTDYTGHRVDRKKDIWGYLKWENGKSTRVAWEK